MQKSTYIYFVIPVLILIIVIVVITMASSSKKSTISTLKNSKQNIITPTTNYHLPTTIPPADFTGADDTQTLPAEVQNVGEQKTALRRLTPLVLPFGTIEFDYENDNFLLQLIGSKEEFVPQFEVWRNENYPALTDDKFIIN